MVILKLHNKNDTIHLKKFNGPASEENPMPTELEDYYNK